MSLSIRDIFLQKLSEIQSRLPIKINVPNEKSAFQQMLDVASNNVSNDAIVNPLNSQLNNALNSALNNPINNSSNAALNALSSEKLKALSRVSTPDPGSSHYSDFLKATLSLQNTNASIPSDNTEKMKEINYNIQLASKKYGIDPNLIRAVIKQESDFDQFSLSHAGAQGLMQLMPETADTLKLTDPWDIAQNIDGGTRHLRDALHAFDGDLKLGLAAYNAGQGAVRKYNGIPPYRETQNYVRKVTDYYAQYSGTR